MGEGSSVWVCGRIALYYSMTVFYFRVLHPLRNPVAGNINLFYSIKVLYLVRINDTFVLRMCSRSVWVNASTRNTHMYSVRLEQPSVVYFRRCRLNNLPGDLTECTLKSTMSWWHHSLMTSHLPLAETTSQVFVMVHVTSIDCSKGRNEPLQYSVTCAFVNKPHERK